MLPCYSRSNTVRLWAGNLLPRFRLGEVIEQMMAAPLFPIRHDIFDADLEFRDFHVGETLTPSSAIKLRTIRLNHPDGATGYRLEYDGRSIAYITDHGFTAILLINITSFLSDVDLLICDCTYTAAELHTHLGWGHSSWQQGMQLAVAARAKRFCLFHHDPDHDDPQLDKIAAEVSKQHPASMVAYEGLTVEI